MQIPQQRLCKIIKAFIETGVQSDTFWTVQMRKNTLYCPTPQLDKNVYILSWSWFSYNDTITVKIVLRHGEGKGKKYQETCARSQKPDKCRFSSLEYFGRNHWLYLSLSPCVVCLYSTWEWNVVYQYKRKWDLTFCFYLIIFSTIIQDSFCPCRLRFIKT